MAKTEIQDDLLHQLGMRVAYLRKEKGMSQLLLSATSGISKNYISDLENGRRNPSLVLLQRLATALDVTLEEFFKGIVPLKNLLKHHK